MFLVIFIFISEDGKITVETTKDVIGDTGFYVQNLATLADHGIVVYIVKKKMYV
jgi:hypothetical protein